jgi:hypothetical protein
MCAAMVKDVSGYFKTGDRVYPTKIEVNQQKAKISFSVVSCDSCNGVDPPTSMKGQVVFQFPKGYLEKADGGDSRERNRPSIFDRQRYSGSEQPAAGTTGAGAAGTGAAGASPTRSADDSVGTEHG